MTKDERYISRVLFELRVYRSDGQAYQDLFTSIMQAGNRDFILVKPQGRIGDRKNDGFDKVRGKYYQVYAPEDLASKGANTLTKLKQDFTALLKYWNNVAPVKEFYFVLNDKYKGVYPTIHKAISAMGKAHHEIRFALLLNKDLEDTFMSLEEDQVVRILNGMVPSADSIGDVDYSILTEVIDYLMNLENSYKPEVIPDKPDFENKITFNSLSRQVADLLRIGNYQHHAIVDFFKMNSMFAKSELKDVFIKLYSQGLDAIPDDVVRKNDLVFFHILERASPSKKKPIQDALLVLMSYYFEYCDIFEAPDNGQ
jgi:hypothetical protein